MLPAWVVYGKSDPWITLSLNHCSFLTAALPSSMQQPATVHAQHQRIVHAQCASI